MKSIILLIISIIGSISIITLSTLSVENPKTDEGISLDVFKQEMIEIRNLMNKIGASSSNDTAKINLQSKFATNAEIICDLYKVNDYFEEGSPYCRIDFIISQIAGTGINYDFIGIRKLEHFRCKEYEECKRNDLSFIAHRRRTFAGTTDKDLLIITFKKTSDNDLKIEKISLFKDDENDGSEDDHEDQCRNERAPNCLNGCKNCPKDLVRVEKGEEGESTGQGTDDPIEEAEVLTRTYKELMRDSILTIAKSTWLSTQEKIDEYKQMQQDFAQSNNYELFLDTEKKIIEEENKNRPLAEKRMFRGGDNYEMLEMEENIFEMGCPKEDCEGDNPLHEVKVSSFYMDPKEVTNRQYLEFLEYYVSPVVKSGPFKGQALFARGQTVISNDAGGEWRIVDESYSDLPVVNVTWYGANEYAKFYNLSLPTEAEWEYAARGGQEVLESKKNADKTFKFAGSDEIDDVAWYNNNSGNAPKKGSLKAPNELGLFDMTGNVHEWCKDIYDDDSYDEKTIKSNPDGPAKNEKLFGTKPSVFRGGAFNSPKNHCYVYKRKYGEPSEGFPNVGFRCVKQVPR